MTDNNYADQFAARLAGARELYDRRQAFNGQRALARALRSIQLCDEQEPPDYIQRYRFVWGALYAATCAGYAAGIAIDPAQPDWPVAYIELPTGQVSWHMPAHTIAWDGHTTETKYRRTAAYGFMARNATEPIPPRDGP